MLTESNSARRWKIAQTRRRPVGALHPTVICLHFACEPVCGCVCVCTNIRTHGSTHTQPTHWHTYTHTSQSPISARARVRMCRRAMSLMCAPLDRSRREYTHEYGEWAPAAAHQHQRTSRNVGSHTHTLTLERAPTRAQTKGRNHTVRLWSS